MRRLNPGNGSGPRTVVRGLYPFVGHGYIKFGDKGYGYYPNDRTGKWTVMEEKDEPTIGMHRWCTPQWVSDCVYDCLKRKMSPGMTGAPVDGASNNNCLTNMNQAMRCCEEECRCKDEKNV